MGWRVLLASVSIMVGFSVIVFVTHRTGSDLRTVAFQLPLRLHVLAFLVTIVEVLARGMRFHLLAKGMGLPLGLPSALLAPLVGDAAGAATPSRIGTDAGKVACLLREGMGLGGAAAVLFGDLVLEAGVLLVGSAVIFPIAPFAWIALAGALAYATVTVLFGAAGVFVAGIPTDKSPPRFWRWLPLTTRRWRQLRVVGRGFLRRARQLRALPWRTWSALFSVSALHFAARLAILPVIAWEVKAPGSLPALVAWPVGLIWVAGFLPPPSGGGGVELGFVATLSSAIPREAMAGSLLWWRFYAFYLPAMVGGLVGAPLFGKSLFNGVPKVGSGVRRPR